MLDFRRPQRLTFSAAGASLILSLLAACAAPPAPTASPTGAAAGAAASAWPTALDRWLELFQRTPYPFTTPLPPATASALDGTYTKTVIKDTPTVKCRRCPEYAPEGGLWKLNFDSSIFRIYHQATGWRSLGSFSVSGSDLTLFNDPACLDVVGRYTWALAGGQLQLTAVDDPCAIALRAMNLTQLPWDSCRPPNTEAAVTGHWPAPPGC